jgi:hypothetical protein
MAKISFSLEEAFQHELRVYNERFALALFLIIFESMNGRRISAWILMAVVALSSGPVQAFVHVCSSQGPQWSESSCSTEHHDKPSCCSKKATVQPKSCCESIYLFGLSAKFKDRAPQQEFNTLAEFWLCKVQETATISRDLECGKSTIKVPFPPPDVRLFIQRINQ